LRTDVGITLERGLVKQMLIERTLSDTQFDVFVASFGVAFIYTEVVGTSVKICIHVFVYLM